MSSSAILQALILLTPYDIDIPKRRIGPDADGGYVFADAISPAQDVLSYGISTEYRFDRVMAEAGHAVHMFDHTIEGIEDAHPNMTWHRQGVAALARPDERLFTVDDHLAMLNVAGGDLILKMDVEGAEIDAIGLMSDATLARFEQIVVEVHDLQRLADAAFRARVERMLAKLNSRFTLFHVHANNFDGPDALEVVAGLPCVSILELSYIRSRRVRRRPSQTLYPTIHDFPNVPGRDKLLWFFPFLPTPLVDADFVACNERLERQWPDATLELETIAFDPRAEPANFVNVARGKPATQSSLSMYSSPDDAQGAVNGEISGGYGFHTGIESRPWWQVDLGESLALEGVVLYNRCDPSGARAHRFVLKLGDDIGDLVQVYAREGRPFGGKTGEPARIWLEGRSARYVRVELDSVDCLHLDEVEVYVKAPARQSR